MSRTPVFPRSLSAFGVAAALGGASVALAGGSAENALLIIDPTNATSLYVGNYYKNARNIPDRNVLYLRSFASDYNQFKLIQQRAFLDALAQRGIGPTIDYVILAPTDVYYVAAPSGLVDDACYPVTRLSITTAYSLSQISSTITPMTDSLIRNMFFSISPTPTFFDASLAYLNGVSSASTSARRYYISALLGYYGPFGNSPDELTQMIDRSVAVDGTRPAGTFYYMNNPSDPARNVRQPGFAAAITQLNSVGGAGTAVQLSGEVPANRTNIRGIMTGMANLNFAGSGSAILPGSFCDNLTSYAATFDDTSQTKVSLWISLGASASAGEVEEPCNYLEKFPSPNFHVWYFRGMSVGEAYFRGVNAVPFQGLLYGDALTKPWAFTPSVTLPSPPTGPVSGSIVLAPQATATAVAATISAMDLLVDGVVSGSIAAPVTGRTFTLDTTALDDGWHDLRIIARDNAATRNQGRWIGSLITQNYGRAASLSASPSAGANLSTQIRFTPSWSGGAAAEYRVVQNGRVIAAAPGSAGPAPLTVIGSVLGAGVSNVLLEVAYADGRIARSTPIAVPVANAAGAPASVAPVAFSYAKRLQTASAHVVELPAVFSDAPSASTFTILSGPSRGTILNPTFTGGYRLIVPSGPLTGSDSMTFMVQTPSGQSNVASVTLQYGPPAICAWDFNGDGVLDPDDLSDYVTAFFASPPSARADINRDGAVDPDDLADFIAGYFGGC